MEEKKYIDPWKISDLDDAIEQLLAARERGEHVYCKFNGHELDSDTVTADSAYEAVTGETREEFKKKLQEEEESFSKEKEVRREEARKRLPSFIVRGEELIFPEKHEEWQRYVENSVEGIYYGRDIEASLEIIEMLESDAPMEDVEATLKAQDHSGWSAGVVRSVVAEFSSRGPEFFEATTPEKISPEVQEKLDALKEENARLKEVHKSAEGKQM